MTDVCIVGYGPVGATLASLLSLSGVSVLVLEREAAPYPLPRAVHFDDEVMRVFQTLGLTDQLLPHVHVSLGMRFVDPDGRLLLDWSRPQSVGPQGWNVSYRFHQPDLERLLRRDVEARANVTVCLNAAVTAVTQDETGATVTYLDRATGSERQVPVGYVVGCDGARSLLREIIGGGLEDLGFQESWLVVDAILKCDMPQLGDYTLQHCDPDRPATYVRGIGNRRRWEISLKPGEDPAAMTDPAIVQGLLARWISPADADLERAVCYSFASVLARRWRAGRLLIAGDAAHQTPPFLGQGLCAGIRDVANLAWKLSKVLQGEAPDSLLDSYQSERSPHVREYIALAVRLGGLINTSDPATALANFNRQADGSARMESIKPRLGPGLSAGCSALTGQVAPQPCLADGRRMDDHVGYGPALLLRPEVAAALSPEQRLSYARRGIALVADDVPALQDWLRSAEVDAVLVRPDRYILGAAKTQADIIELAAAA